MKRRLLLIMARLKKNFTTDYMAQQLGITRTQYSNIENGHTLVIKQQHIEKVAALLDIPAECIDIDEDKIVIKDSFGILNGGENNTQTNHFANEQLLKMVEQQQETITKQQDMIQKLMQQLIKP